MGRRTYGQYCGLGRALEIVGERWALLIVRDLIIGPKRFTDLRQGLPRIPTNVLSTRLRELEDAGVIHRRVLPRPANAVVYELTDYGRELDDILLRLGRWGTLTLGEPEPDDIVTVDSLIMAVRSTFRPDIARGPDVSYELHADDVIINIRIVDGELTVEPGELPGADLVIRTSPAAQKLLTRDVSTDAALADGSLWITGDPALLTRFVEIFHA